MIAFLKKRRQLLKFESISVSVEATTGREFKLKHFCQILTASPHMYSHEWKRASGEKSYSLFIDFPESEAGDSDIMNKRADSLKAALLDITNQHHSRFLKMLIAKRPALKEYLEDYNPIDHKAWYHEFNPNDQQMVPLLTQASLNEKPQNERRSESVSEFLKRNRSSQKNESLNKVSTYETSYNLQNVRPNALPQATPKPKESQPLEISSNGIPTDLLKRIQEREKIHKEEKLRFEADYNTKKHTIMKESLFKFSETLKSIYTVRRINVLPLSKLMTELEDSQHGIFEDSSTVADKLKHMHAASPQWLKIISLPDRKLVKLNPNYKKGSVRIDIEKYTEKLQEEEKTN